MHIRDGILSPEVCVVASAISLVAVGYSLKRLRTDLEDRAVPLTGMMAAVVFAGQMVNFPLIGLPVSGHLLGGVLASAILGPWAGCLAISLVLIVQAILFNDGGLLSLGANVLNMAVVGSWGGYAVYALLKKWFGNSPISSIPAAVIAAWVSVLAAATLFCLEFSLSAGTNQFGLRGILTLMIMYHAIIGVGEALITGSILSFIVARRPELISAPVSSGPVTRVGRFVAAGLVFALAIAAFLAPFKSDFPDGLDSVSQSQGFDVREADRPALMLDDYDIPWFKEGQWSSLGTSLAGILGTVVVFAIALILGRTARWNAIELAAEGGHAT